MTEQSFLARRLDSGTWPIAVGDFVVLFAFLLVGVLRHWTFAQLQANPGIYLNAAAPFFVGWLLVAPLVGAYSPGARSAPNSSIPLAIRSWIPAAIVGLLIRATPVVDGGFDPVFAAIMIVGGAVSLSVWRLLYFKLR
ncbi:MAG: DUF3054 domain-containing protein [Natronomonas sp.]